MNIKSELSVMTNIELMAYFNILRAPCLPGGDFSARKPIHMSTVLEILNDRGLGRIAARAIEKKKPVTIR